MEREAQYRELELWKKKKINKRKNQCKWLMFVVILNVYFMVDIDGTILAFKLLHSFLDHWWSLKYDWLIHAIFISITYSAVNHPVHVSKKSKMYKLSNLYKRAQYGKGKGKAGPRRVEGEGRGARGGRYSRSV